jgi:hypothetical protein
MQAAGIEPVREDASPRLCPRHPEDDRDVVAARDEGPAAGQALLSTARFQITSESIRSTTRPINRRPCSGPRALHVVDETAVSV